MTDLQLAVKELDGHSVCLCRNGTFTTFDGRGIQPLIRAIEMNVDFSGYSAADIIVGKAAAMLFVKLGVVAVHGCVMSEAAKEFLERKSIPYSFDKLTDKIINRSRTGICPMEQTVSDIDNIDKAYTLLRNKIAELKAMTPEN